MTQYGIDGVQLAATLTGFWLLAFWLYNDYRVDSLRQKLFDLRTELFLYVAKTDLDFDHPAYGALRARINRMIQFAHKFNSIQLVLFLFAWRVKWIDFSSDELSNEWDGYLSTVESDTVRKDLQRFSARATTLMAQRLIFGSWLLMFGLAVFVACALLRDTIQSALRMSGDAMGKAAAIAFDKFRRLVPGMDLLEAELARASGFKRGSFIS